MKKDLISMSDVRDELVALLDSASNLKNRQKGGVLYEPLKNKTLAMIFEKPSTRTRVSFEVAMAQLGGHALNLSPRDMQMGRGETVADTAKVLSRYVDAIMYRGFSHDAMIELARSATVPVINGLDDLEHPCQIIADLLTVREHKGDFSRLKLAYVGDGNNVCNSLMVGCAIVGMEMAVATPEGYEPNAKLVKEAEGIAKEKHPGLSIMTDPKKAVENADVVYTDVWISMGQESEKEEKEKKFRPYQVNADLVGAAKKNCIVMHCLPAHRGLEITDEVIDGKHSVVLDQAENRLHAQKAVLVRLMER